MSHLNQNQDFQPDRHLNVDYPAAFPNLSSLDETALLSNSAFSKFSNQKLKASMEEAHNLYQRNELLANILEDRHATHTIRNFKDNLNKGLIDPVLSLAMTGLVVGALVGMSGYLGAHKASLWIIRTNWFGASLAALGFLGTSKDEGCGGAIFAGIIGGVIGHYLGVGAQNVLTALHITSMQAVLQGAALGALIGLPFGLGKRISLRRRNPEVLKAAKEAVKIERKLKKEASNGAIFNATLATKIEELRNSAQRARNDESEIKGLLLIREVAPLVDEAALKIQTELNQSSVGTAEFLQRIDALKNSITGPSFTKQRFKSAHPKIEDSLSQALTTYEHLSQNDYQTEFARQLQLRLKDMLEIYM